MESGIKHTNLRNIGQNGGNSVYTLQVGRIVKRSQIIAGSKGVQHLLSQQNGFAELLAAVYHTVTYRIDFVQRLDCAVFGADQCIEDELHTHSMLRYVFFQNFLPAIRQGQFQERAFQTDFFNATLSDNLFMVHIKQLIFDGRATAVQY